MSKSDVFNIQYQYLLYCKEHSFLSLKDWLKNIVIITEELCWCIKTNQRNFNQLKS